MRLLITCLIAFGWMATAAMAESKVWRDSRGREFQAEYMGRTEDTVFLRLPNGKEGGVAIDKLSDEDQQFVNSRPLGRPQQQQPAVADAAAEPVTKDRFTEAIEKNPSDAGAYYQRGMMLVNKGQADEAIRDFNKAISLKPKFAAAYDGRGIAYSKMGKPFEAHQEFSRAIEMDPEMPSAYKNRGENLKDLWKTPQGKEVLREQADKYRKRYELARQSNLDSTPWQPLNTTSGNTLPSALGQMAQVDFERARQLEAKYGGGVSGGYGIAVGGVGIGGPNVKIVGPGTTVVGQGTTVIGNPALAVYPEEVVQGQTVTLVANPAELQKNMPAQLGPNGKPVSRRGAYGKEPPKEPVYGVDFYRDVDGDGLLNPDADQYLASDNNGKDGFSAEVSTAALPPGNQAYFAVGRGKQPDGVPSDFGQAAKAVQNAASTEKEIAQKSEAAKQAGGYSTEQAQQLRDQQKKLGESTQKLAQGLQYGAPEAAQLLAQATKPMTAVDNRLSAAEKRPGETSIPIAEAAAEKANEAASLLEQAAAKLAEKADQQGEGGPSPASPASAPAAASGKINPAKPGPGDVAGGPGKGGDGKGGDGNGGDSYDDDDRVARIDDDDRVVIRDEDDDVVVYDDDDVDVVIDRALGHIDDGDYDLAIDQYDDYLDLHPDDDLVLRRRADTYVARGGYDYAVRDYDRLASLKGYVMSADLYYNRGCAHLAAGRIDESIADFNASIKLDETRNLAYTNRGSAYARKGMYQEAVVDFNKAIEINPRDHLAHRNRALAYKKMGKLQQAQVDFERAREIAAQIGSE